jgi:RNA polymerase sigma-70 factor (ECF subfamily)
MNDAEPDSGDSLSLPPPVALPPGLLGTVLRGDPEGWQRLVYLYVPLVLLWCRDRGLSNSQAEEAACEIFHLVAARLGEFASGMPLGGFRSWLRQLVVEYLKDLPATGVGELSEREAERGLLYRRALDLLRAEFEPAQWEAARGILLDRQTPESVSAELGLSLAAIYTAKAFVLGRLREELRNLEA